MACNKNKMYKTLDYSSRDMLNFNFLEKGPGLVSPPHLEYDFLGKLFLIVSYLLTDQMSLSDGLYFSKYWAICVSQLFINQAVTL